MKIRMIGSGVSRMPHKKQSQEANRYHGELFLRINNATINGD